MKYIFNTTTIKKVGANIKRDRVEQGMTQAQIAKQLKCDPSKLNRIEKGKTDIKLSDLIVIAKALKVNIDTLLT